MATNRGTTVSGLIYVATKSRKTVGGGVVTVVLVAAVVVDSNTCCSNTVDVLLVATFNRGNPL